LVRSSLFVVELLGEGSSAGSPVVDLRFESLDDRLQLVLAASRRIVLSTSTPEVAGQPGDLSVLLHDSFVFGA
jgi:hypothetical protein